MLLLNCLCLLSQRVSHIFSSSGGKKALSIISALMGLVRTEKSTLICMKGRTKYWEKEKNKQKVNNI